ncbi:hypothetical protein Tco_0990302 [Tanacetum coccineum]|uniref:Uncharacterized protein n=1 Tax=Tanacetum coccineum TaxID=301880 RepID=A0ABQ5EWV3_9ASTR
MAESSLHNPSSPKITAKEESITLEKPESPNPFLPADQIEFTFKETAFTTNNEVALLYPSHPNSEYFRENLDDSKIWVSTPTCQIRGDIGYIGEIRAKGNLKKSFLPPRFIEDVITKKIVYHLFDDEVEFLGCVILSYLLALEITCSCFHDFIDKDLIDLVLPDVRSDHYIEPTEFEIQEMVNIWVSGEAY